MVRFFIYSILVISMLLAEHSAFAEQRNSYKSLPPGIAGGAKDRGNGDPKYWNNNPSGVGASMKDLRSSGQCDQSKCVAMPMHEIYCGNGQESVWETPKGQCCPVLKCKPVVKRGGGGCNTNSPIYACPAMEPVCNEGEEVVILPPQTGSNGSCCSKKICRKIGIKDGREGIDPDTKPIKDPKPLPAARAI